MREPSPEDSPYVGENEVEMKEQPGEKRERDKVERGRRKRRREEEHRGSKRSGETPERGQLRPRILNTYEEFPPEWENLELWEENGNVQNEKYSRIGQSGGIHDKEVF